MNIKIIALTVIVFVAALSSSVLLFQYLNTSANNANQTETLEITDSAVWYQNTWSYAQAALIVVNDGKTDAIINKITVRGISCSWSDIYYLKGEIGSVSNLNPASEELSGSSVDIVVDNKEQTFLQATGPLALKSFETFAFYVKNPANITLEDIPTKVTIAIYTEKDLYYKETDVVADMEAQIEFMGSSSVTITSVQFAGTSGAADNTIILTMKNTGTKQVAISVVKVNNLVASVGSDSATSLAPSDAGKTLTINNVAWVSGNPYKVDIYDASGQVVGSYMATAPS